jgi:hypothetical protein
MNRRGASGIDGETTKEFEQQLDTRVQDLCERFEARGLSGSAGAPSGDTQIEPAERDVSTDKSMKPEAL